MNPSTETKTAPPNVEDPFRYGWRYLRHEGADGSVSFEQVPLTAKDLLYPQEDDFVVNNEAHDKNCGTIHTAYWCEPPDERAAVSYMITAWTGKCPACKRLVRTWLCSKAKQRPIRLSGPITCAARDRRLCWRSR